MKIKKQKITDAVTTLLDPRQKTSRGDHESFQQKIVWTMQTSCWLDMGSKYETVTEAPIMRLSIKLHTKWIQDR